MTVRAYVPTTLRLLAQARDRGRFGPSPVAAHAVTAALRGLDEGAGDEELEWAASTSASVDSLRLLADEATDGPADGPGEDAGLRRVVAAVDVPTLEAGDGNDPSAVLLTEVPLRRLAALLDDDVDAAHLVGAARDALASGADDDHPAVERCLEQELGWYAASELDLLLDGWT